MELINASHAERERENPESRRASICWTPVRGILVSIENESHSSVLCSCPSDGTDFRTNRTVVSRLPLVGERDADQDELSSARVHDRLPAVLAGVRLICIHLYFVSLATMASGFSSMRVDCSWRGA